MCTAGVRSTPVGEKAPRGDDDDDPTAPYRCFCIVSVIPGAGLGLTAALVRVALEPACGIEF